MSRHRKIDVGVDLVLLLDYKYDWENPWFIKCHMKYVSTHESARRKWNFARFCEVGVLDSSVGILDTWEC